MSDDLDDDTGMIDCCENNNKHGNLCDNITCDCICHEPVDKTVKP